MALAFFVEDRPDGLAAAFAAHDEYLSVFTYFVSGCSKKAPMLTPQDDFYSAPYCFMPKTSRNGFLVFTCQVPWLQGNPLEGDATRAHQAAHEWQEQRGKFKPPHIGTVEQFQVVLSLKERDVYTFTETGCYPSKDDVSQALEDRAVSVTCDALGWETPRNWRTARQKLSQTHLPILNLADWDSRKRKHSSSCDTNSAENTNDSSNHDVPTTRKGDVHCIAQEEKKDSDSAEGYHQC